MPLLLTSLTFEPLSGKAVSFSDKEIDAVFDEIDYDKSGELDLPDLVKRLERETGQPKGMQRQQLRQELRSMA